jgi:hypothetical protein
VGAPVSFMVAKGGGWLAPSSVGAQVLSASLNLVTDSLGMVSAAYKQPNVEGVESEVTFSAGAAALSLLSRSSVLPAPVGCWKFDESSGTVAVDSTATSGNGQMRNGASRVTGVFSTALGLNGTNQDVQVANDSDLNMASTSFGISLWFKRDLSNAAACLLDKTSINGSAQAQGYRISIDAPGSLAILLGNEATGDVLKFKTVTQFADTKWHQIVLSVDQSDKTAKVYVDGVPRDLTLLSGSAGTAAGTVLKFSTVSSLNVSSTAAMQFGSSQGSASFLQGKLEEIRIYHEALPPKGVWELSDTDFDGLPDAWEMQNFNNLDQSGLGDPDGDGFTNLEEWQNEVNPNDASNGGKVVPRLFLISGAGQHAAAGEFLAEPFVFVVKNAQGGILSNQTITFMASAGYGRVVGYDGIERERVQLPTNTQGQCELWVRALAP